jgi:hypothetical protein
LTFLIPFKEEEEKQSLSDGGSGQKEENKIAEKEKLVQVTDRLMNGSVYVIKEESWNSSFRPFHLTHLFNYVNRVAILISSPMHKRAF